MLRKSLCSTHIVRLGVAAWISAVVSPAALACSTCKCADPTVNLFGTEKPFEQRLRLALDFMSRSETQGDPAVNARQTDEQRMLLGLAWNPTTDLTLIAQLPYVSKRIEDSNRAAQEAHGLGDVDLLARWTLLRSGGGSGSHLAGLRLGVRLPTTEQLRDADGVLFDIDVQPDAGATAPNIGGWYAHFAFPWFASASVNYLHYGDGHQGFAPGDSALVSLLAQYGLSYTLAVQAGVDARYSERNRFSGVVDEDSGGALAMAFGGVALRLFGELIVSAGVQLPLIDQLNGYQTEDPALRAGLAYDF